MTTVTEVKIDLFKPNLPGNIEHGAFVQQHLKEDLLKEIETVIEEQGRLPDQPSTLGIISEAGKQLFFIDGTRGAGKTTFMNDIVAHYRGSKHIHALRCIDPTKLPQVEPILITVIAQLNSDVTEHFKKENGWDISSTSRKEPWQQCLKKISRAIQLLGKKEYSTDFFDEALELNALLNNASDGLGLEEQFSKLLALACNILGCKAILVAFDDIDTKFDTGWQVLESIRKYFNSHQLIVLMTGDLRLYSQLIRGKQYANYDAVLMQQEADELEKQNRSLMVNHLEQQYLIKLLPVHRRINLQSLYQLVNENGRAIHVYSNNETNPDRGEKPMRKAVDEMLAEGLHLRTGDDLKLFADEILKQPIRLVLQLLQRYYQQKSVNRDRSCADIFCEAIRSTMLGSIYKAGLNYDSSDAHVGIIAKDIFNYTLMDGDTNTGFYLRPQSELEILRSSAIYMAALVSKTAEGSLWKTLHLMLAGCGSVTLYDKLLQDYSQKISDKDDIKESCTKYFGLGRSESLMHWSNRSNAALCPVNQDNIIGVHPGLIRLNRTTPKNENRINGTVAPYNSDKEDSILAKLAVDIASSDLAGRNMHSFVSITNLIGGIADLIDGYGFIDDEGNDHKLRSLLSKLAFRTTCSAPSWSTLDKADFVDNEDLPEGFDSMLSNMREDTTSAISIIKAWLKSINGQVTSINPSSMLIGKIWTRLYFNLANIAEAHKNNLGSEHGLKGTNSTDTNAAKIMRFNVIAFLHAVLFEEDAYHKTDYEPVFVNVNDRKNPVTSVDLLVAKTDVLAENKNQIKNRWPLFYLLVTCPLLHPFLFAKGAILASSKAAANETKLKEFITDICSNLYENYIPETHSLKYLYTASITATKNKKVGRSSSDGRRQATAPRSPAVVAAAGVDVETTLDIVAGTHDDLQIISSETSDSQDISREA